MFPKTCLLWPCPHPFVFFPVFQHGRSTVPPLSTVFRLWFFFWIWESCPVLFPEFSTPLVMLFLWLVFLFAFRAEPFSPKHPAFPLGPAWVFDPTFVAQPPPFFFPPPSPRGGNNRGAVFFPFFTGPHLGFWFPFGFGLRQSFQPSVGPDGRERETSRLSKTTQTPFFLGRSGHLRFHFSPLPSGLSQSPFFLDPSLPLPLHVLTQEVCLSFLIFVSLSSISSPVSVFFSKIHPP